jgi:DNA-binding MarR family transcriptional regulator
VKQRDHYRQVLRLITAIGRLTNPQHLPALSERKISLSQFLVLDALAAAERPVRMAELSRLSSLSSTELSRVVASLEAASWAQRRTDPDDSRGRLVAITAQGRRVHRGAERQATSDLQGVWDDFTHDEWHRFIDYLGRFEAGLRRVRGRALDPSPHKPTRTRKEPS